MKQRILIAQLHRWVGAISSLFILLVAISGVMLAFMGELFLAQHGDLLRSSAPAEETHYAAVDALIDSAEAGYGTEFTTMGVLMPHTRIDKVETALVFGLPAGAESVDQLLMLSVDPWTADYKGEFALRKTFGHELVEFHHSLLLGDGGIMFIAMLGVVLALMTISGLWVWWPRQGSTWHKVTHISLRAGVRALWLSLHSLAGVWLSALLLFFAITGIATAKPSWFGPLLAAPIHQPPLNTGFEKKCAEQLSPSEVSITGQNVFSDRSLAIFFMPNKENGPYMLTYRSSSDGNKLEGDGRVFVHASCTDLVHIEDNRQAELPSRLANMMLSLHGGYSFGRTVGDILVLIGGIGLTWLAASGLYLFCCGRRFTRSASKNTS